MTIFLILAIYLLIINIAIPESSKKKKTIWAALGFVLVLALRSPYCGLDVTGTDSIITPTSYGGVFLSIGQYSFWDLISKPTSVPGEMEVGWLVFTKFISIFTGNLQIYLAIVAVISFIPIVYIISKYSKNVILSCFIFACLGFYVHYFSGIRQMTALSILLLAFDQLYQKKYLWFVIITIIASTIHRSALFFIVIWPLSFIHLSFFAVIIVIMIFVGLMPFYQDIVLWILNVFFNSDYVSYLEDEGQATTLFIVYTLFLLLSFIKKDNNRQMGLLRMTVLIGVAGQSLGVLGSGAITRIGYYFNVFLMLLLPEIVDSFKEQKTKVIINSIAIVLLCLFFYLTTTSANSSGVIPYSFYWNNPVHY